MMIHPRAFALRDSSSVSAVVPNTLIRQMLRERGLESALDRQVRDELYGGRRGRFSEFEVAQVQQWFTN